VTGILPKLLVLGSSLPGSKHGGGVVQAEILKRYPRDRYVCFSVDPSDGGDLPECLRDVPCRIAPLAPRPHLRGARFYLPVLRAIGFHFVAPRRVRQAVAFGRRHGVELVWAELQGDALVIAKRVADGLGVPLVGTVWDDPGIWLDEGGYDRLSQQLLKKRFREALVWAHHLSTAGEVMREFYEMKYGVKSVILRHGFESPAVLQETQRSKHGLIIGFVGSAYGRDAWSAFLSVVARLNAAGNLPKISLRVFGAGKFPYHHPGVEIEFKGWQPAELMLSQIAETDFCYLPYWFEPKKRLRVELSFPNKFETYIAAARPILFHGPEYAGIAKTISQYGVGLCVHSLEHEEILVAIERLILDQPLLGFFTTAAASAFRQEFNASKMMQNFAEMIGVDSNSFQGKL
jgi:hypothetical protein